MKKYALIQGARYQLLDELEDHVIGAEHLGANSVAAHRAALLAIRDGANEAETSRAVYRVIVEPHPTLTRTDVREGTREELLEELEQLRADRERQGRADRVAEYDEAIGDLRRGSPRTYLPRTMYLVAEPHE